MKVKFIPLGFLLLLAISVQAQRKQQKQANIDTIVSNYQPADLFSPLFYPQRGNEFHSANGEPEPKYWQNKVYYQLKANIDTTTKTLTATENIEYVNNSPDALQYLWLQLDQNTYKKDARSNFATGVSPAPDQHTAGYQIESVSIDNGDIVKSVEFIVTDTRMQIRLAKAIMPHGGGINLRIKY